MKKAVLTVVLVFGVTLASYAQEAFLGEVRMFAGNFAPRGWAFCDGQLLAISQHTALFSILGTTYGGDGRTTFALPDLRGRTPVHPGQGPGLSRRLLGQSFGQESVTLTALNMPLAIPYHHVSSTEPQLQPGYNSVLVVGNEATGSLMQGQQQAVRNEQPSLGINYIICLTGVFPSRN